MRVLFAVNNEKISESIIKKYQLDYKEIISAKNVYYFNAIIKELQRNRNYDRIVISEDLEPYSNRNYEMIDKFLFDKLDNISDEASNNTDSEIPIILICTDRREKGETILTKLFSIGLYSALIGNDRTIENLCTLINKPRSKREAKAYYKIDVDDADYKSELTTEVNETEVQNILNHFKRIGQNENAYITSFNDISSQYTEEQLKIIVGYLPLNVRAVLEENCPAYQKLMLASVKGKIKEKKEKAITTKNINMPNKTNNNIDLINKTLQKPRMTKPVVIPSSIDANNVKKVYRQTQHGMDNISIKPTVVSGEVRPRKLDIQDNRKVQYQDQENSINVENQNTISNELENIKDIELPKTTSTQLDNDVFEEDIFDSSKEQKTNVFEENSFESQNDQTNIDDNIFALQNDQNSNDFEEDISTVDEEKNDIEDVLENVQTDDQVEGVIPKKRGRGRPPKIKPQGEITQPDMPKRGRGRPRKAVPQAIGETIPETKSNNEDLNLFDLDENDANATPDINFLELDEQKDEKRINENSDVDLFNLEDSTVKEDDDINLFDLDNEPSNTGKDHTDLNLFDLEESQTDNNINLFDLDNQENNGISNSNLQTVSNNTSAYNQRTEQSNSNNQNVNTSMLTGNLAKTQNSYNEINLTNLLTSDKKIVAFVGTSKNGTSFLVNNVAALMASKGINTAILDLTKNKNAYYIYTQNDETLRTQSSKCIEGLRRGIPNGINVERNLTVYTTLPNEDSGIEDYSNILQTLIKNYSLVILDCDFNTNLNYFASAQEIYLIQTYDILTIQPLTAFVRELEDKNVINSNKLRVVVNKVLKVKNLNEKMIIGGISKYNSPDMTYQKDLFDINNIMYTTIPFEDQTYAKYLEGLVTCNISLNGYSRGLLEALEVLGDMVYPLISRKQYGNTGYNNYNNYNKYNSVNNTKSQFNSSIDNTLNKMRKSY